MRHLAKRLFTATSLALSTVPISAWAQTGMTSSLETTVAEVVITAQKRVERLNDVPISAMALGEEQLERRGVKDIADLARLTPGLFLSGSDDSGDVNIALRGVVSTVGAPTTGIYIDDVPIHVRQDAGVWSNPYPKIFDLERVEVLRGPQGAMFGSSSEGGAVRFITPSPSKAVSGRATFDTFGVQEGALGFAAGFAAGGPIVPDKLAFRFSLWRREDGGYARRVDPVTLNTLKTQANGSQATSARLKLQYTPTDRLTVTPSLFFQDTHADDNGMFWPRGGGDYVITSKIASPDHDRFFLAAVSADYRFDFADFKSISSGIYRKDRKWYDSTQYLFASYSPDILFLPDDPANSVQSSFVVPTRFVSTQQSYSQELRLTSPDPTATVSWVAGVFYQHEREGYDGRYEADMDQYARYLGGADSEGYFGEAAVDGRFAYIRHYVDEVEETAAFGSATLRLSPTLKFQAGLRYAKSGYSYRDYQDGPWGPGAPTSVVGSKNETSVTPRFTLSYQPDRDLMVYASAAKGYRMGGVNQPVPSDACSGDLSALGLTAAPKAYDSDSLWSYEVGYKGKTLNRTLTVQTSAYWIDWSDIQQSVYLSGCGYGYIANLGKAISRGIDLQTDWTPVRALTFTLAAGYTDAFNAQNSLLDGVLLAKKGDPLATPKWTAAASAEYRFTPFVGVDGYTRLDYVFNDSYHRQGSTDVFGVIPLTRNAPPVRTLSARLGLQIRQLEASLYVDNLTDERTTLYQTIDSADTTPQALRGTRLKPRTIGISLSYSY